MTIINMKMWILIIATMHGETRYNVKFNSYDICRQEGARISKNFPKSSAYCIKERPFLP